MRMNPRHMGAAFSFLCLAGAAGVFFTQYWLADAPTTRAAAAATPVTAPAAAAPMAPIEAAAGSADTVVPVSAPRAAASSDIAYSTVAAPRISREGPGLQCAIYARQRTGVSLSGAARMWWGQAEGRYRRSHTPEAGAVMAMLGTSAGHVAVVARVINDREILIDHANWLGGGEIITGALAVDVSPANDWTQVRVWHPPTNSLGVRPYPVQGFIHPGAVGATSAAL